MISRHALASERNFPTRNERCVYREPKRLKIETPINIMLETKPEIMNKITTAIGRNESAAEACSQARLHHLTGCLPIITNAIPPRIAAEAINRRNVMASPRKMMPPTPAMTGTQSCTVAALVAFSPRKAAYQIA